MSMMMMERAQQDMFFYLGTSPITWCSTKQEIVALSSCEAEFITTRKLPDSEGNSEGLCVRRNIPTKFRGNSDGLVDPSEISEEIPRDNRAVDYSEEIPTATASWSEFPGNVVGNIGRFNL